MVNDLSEKIPKLPQDLQQNVNWNQTLLNNEVDLSLNRVWACWLPLISMPYSSQKHAKLERKYYPQYIFKFDTYFVLRTQIQYTYFVLRTQIQYTYFEYVKQSTYIEFKYLKQRT